MPPAVSSSESEQPLLRQTDAGSTLHWKGINFYPGADPVEYARRKARVFSLLPRTLVFVPSVGLGYGLDELLRALPAGSEVLCVEAFQEVMRIALTGIPRDSRLHVVRTADAADAAAVLRQLGPGRFRRVAEVPLCAGYRAAPGLYADIRSLLEQEVMRYWQNRLTMIALGSLQVRNLISNLALLPAADDFSALFTDRPVVVAGAGPSLEGSLPLLAEQRGRFTLVAVDTALPTLRGGGLAPDLVVAVEAQAANNQDFIPAPAAPALLAADLSVHPSAARLFPGRLYFFSSEFAPLRFWERLARAGLRPFPFPALGSVGVAAVHAAVALTTGAIFLTGLDFSFPDGRTHARGSPVSLSMLARCCRLEPAGQDVFRSLEARRLVRRPDKRGRPVLTDRVMSSYRDGLEAEVRAASRPFFDCGETGLPLGARTISESEFAALLPAAAVTGQAVRVRPDRRFAGSAVRPFIASERSLLAEFLRAPSGPRLSEIDYAWAHFPDEPEPSSPDQGFVARARVAALYYDERWRRIESVL